MSSSPFPVNPHPAGISATQALTIAHHTVAAMSTNHDFVLELAKTQEHPFGWVFFYTPSQYLKTGERRFLAPGNGPLVVHRGDGHTEFLSTSMPVPQAIKVLEQRLAATR